MVLWSRQREETDSYNQGIGWDIPPKLFLIFEGNGSIYLPHVRTGTLPQEKALPVVVVQFSFTKFSVIIVWTFWLNRLPFKIIFVKLIVLMTLTVPKVWSKASLFNELWTQFTRKKSFHSKYKVVQQNPIIREFWSFPSRNPVAFGLCLPRTQGENVEIRLCDLTDWRVTHPAKFHPVLGVFFNFTNRIYWQFAHPYLVKIDRSVENFFFLDNKTQCPGSAKI